MSQKAEAKEGYKRWESWKDKITSFLWWKLLKVVFSAIKLNSNPLPWLQKHILRVCQETEKGGLSMTSLHSNLQTSHFWVLVHLFSDPAALSEFAISASCCEN